MRSPAAVVWHDARTLHRAANALVVLTLLGLAGAGAHWFVTRPDFTLRAVAIEPARGTKLRFVSNELLRNSSVRAVEGSFFSVDLDKVRARYESLPWVRRATVRRIWPNRLVVTIEEHRPFAIWGAGRLLNTHGEVFSANLAEAEEHGALPELSGPNGSHGLVLARYDDLTRWLAPLERAPRAVALSQRWAWTAQLDDGTTLLLGREQGLAIESRVARWVALYPRVQARFAEGATVVDLRYPNGFAVRSASANAIAIAPAAAAAAAADASRGRRRSETGVSRAGYRQ